MTDKQIIDGVDVSGCKNFYAKTKDCVQEDTIDTPCVDHPNCYYKQLKRKEDLLNDIEKVIEPYQTEIEAEAFSLPTAVESILERKEQECDRLKKIIDEAKNSKLDLKSFLVGDAVQNEYEEQLDQLKLDNKHLNGLLDQALKELEEMRELNDENSLRVTQLATKCSQLEKAIEKIKELIQNEINDCEHCDDCASCEYNCCLKQALQICDEVNDER